MSRDNRKPRNRVDVPSAHGICQHCGRALIVAVMNPERDVDLQPHPHLAVVCTEHGPLRESRKQWRGTRPNTSIARPKNSTEESVPERSTHGPEQDRPRV